MCPTPMLPLLTGDAFPITPAYDDETTGRASKTARAVPPACVFPAP